VEVLESERICNAHPAPQPKNKEQVQQRYAVGQTIESRIIKDSKVVQLSMK
jgi:hypothetical protein